MSTSDRTPLLPSNQKDVQRSEERLQNYGSRAEQTAQSVQEHAKRALRNPERALNEATPSHGTQKDFTRAVAALKAGKLPSNAQLVKWAEFARNSSFLQEGPFERTGALSEDGSRVVQDVKSVIDELISLAEEKNEGDLIQNFIFSVTSIVDQADTVNVPDVKNKALRAASKIQPDTKVDVSGELPSQKQVKADAEKAAQAVQTLVRTVVTDSSFRGLLSEIINAARDIFADAASEVAEGASSAAEAARPSEDERSSLDYEKVGKEGKAKAKALERDYKTGRLQTEVRESAFAAKDWIDERLPTDARDALSERLTAIIKKAQSKPEYKDAVNGLSSLFRRYRTIATRSAKKAADQAKQAGKEVADKTKKEAQKVADDAADEASSGDVDLSGAADHGKELLERFANGKSLDDVISTFQTVLADVENDERLSSYVDDWGSYVNRLLEQENYVGSKKAGRRFDELIDRGEELAKDEKWKKDADALASELRAFGEALANDEGTTALLEALEDLSDDVKTLGESAFNIFKAEASSLQQDLLNVILPRLLSAVKEIELPRAEYKSEDFDFVLDGVKIAGLSGSLVPDSIRLSNFNEFVFEQGYAAFATNARSNVKVSVTGLNVAITDAAYYVQKRTGWKHDDWGLLDIEGKDFDCEIELATPREGDRNNLFRVVSVETDTSAFKISVKNTHRPISNFFILPFIRAFMKTKLSEILNEAIENQLKQLDTDLAFAHARSAAVGRYAATAGGAPSILGYFKALVGNVTGGGAALGSGNVGSTKGITRRGTHGESLLCIGVEKHILPGRGGPEGWYEDRQAELQAAADKVQAKSKAQMRALSREAKRAEREERSKSGWKSDAFDLGSN